MSFEFEAGTEEKHRVEYGVSRWMGTISIRVDRETIQKHLNLFYGNLIALLFLIASFVVAIISGVDDISIIFGVVAFGFILMPFPIYISEIFYQKKFPITFTVGEGEKHNVQIARIRKRFPIFSGAEYHIYIDNKLFRTIIKRWMS